jgi:hypothetical protein
MCGEAVLVVLLASSHVGATVAEVVLNIPAFLLASCQTIAMISEMAFHSPRESIFAETLAISAELFAEKVASSAELFFEAM